MTVGDRVAGPHGGVVGGIEGVPHHHRSGVMGESLEGLQVRTQLLGGQIDGGHVEVRVLRRAAPSPGKCLRHPPAPPL